MVRTLLLTIFMFSCGATINTEVKKSNNCTSLSGDCMDCLSNLWNKGEDKPDRKNCSACTKHDECVSGTSSLPTLKDWSTIKGDDSDE